MALTKQMIVDFKIRSDGSAWGWGPIEAFTEQKVIRFKIRSVSDGSAWGWGPMRTK
jgi:hypothetical protein